MPAGPPRQRSSSRSKAGAPGALASSSCDGAAATHGRAGQAEAGDERRRDAEKIVSEIVAASRKSAEQFGDAVQREVAKQLTKAVKRIDHLEKQVETLTRSLEATRAVLVATAAKSVADSVAKRKAAATTTTTTAEPVAPAKKATARRARQEHGPLCSRGGKARAPKSR